MPENLIERVCKCCSLFASLSLSRRSDADAVISFELMYKSLKKKKEAKKKAGGCCEAFWINSHSGECKSEDFVLVFCFFVLFFLFFFLCGCFSKVGRKYAPKKKKKTQSK